MALRNRLRQFAVAPFARSVGILVGGTAFAQAILVLILPVLTRLYAPGDFDLLAVFTGVVSIISVAVALRYDIAVPLPEDDVDGLALVVLGAGISTGISLIIAVPFVLAPMAVAGLIGQPDLAPFLWLIPLVTLTTGLYSVLTFWFVRKKSFGTIARGRVFQSIGNASTQAGLGLLGIAPGGLLLGQLANTGLGTLQLGWHLLKLERGNLQRLDGRRIWHNAVAYRKFPLFSSVESIANSAALYLPIILLSSMASGPEAGYLLLGMYALQAPMSIIGGAVSQVYMSRGPQEYRAGRLGDFSVEVIGGLIKTGIGPLVALGIAAPEVFELVFGPDWGRAGQLVTWMTPWFALQFLSSPVALTLHITGQVRTAMVLQIFGLALRVVSIPAAALLATAPFSESYALSGAIFYGVYLFTIIHAAKASWVEAARLTVKALPIIAVWVVLGIAAKLVAPLLGGILG